MSLMMLPKTEPRIPECPPGFRKLNSHAMRTPLQSFPQSANFKTFSGKSIRFQSQPCDFNEDF